MNVHKNARLTAHSRAELVRRVLDGGQTPKAVATAFGVDGPRDPGGNASARTRRHHG
jgi:transposase-like protein